MRTLDGVVRNYREQGLIGTHGEMESKDSELSARIDDDDYDDNNVYIHTYMPSCTSRMWHKVNFLRSLTG